MAERDEGRSLHAGDLYAWSLQQAALLRAGRFDQIDIENVADGIEGLGKAEAQALLRSYRSIAGRLLAISVQAEPPARDRVVDIVRERLDAESCLKASPSLDARRAELFARAYGEARKIAAAETGLSLKTFPIEPPFTLEDVSSEEYTPWTALATPGA